MNVTYPETIWEYSPESEAQRVVFVAQMIQSYFYQIKGFLVLPDIATDSVNTIYFPNLPIVHHPYFWKKVFEEGQVEGNISRDIIEQIKTELPKVSPPTLIQSQWDKVAPEFWNHLQTYLPEVSAKINKLVIRQTAYGSRASGVRKKKSQPGEVTIYLRFDAKLSHIPAAIFIATLDNIHKNGLLYGFNWEERQAIGDFLLCHTSLAGLFPKHESTILAVRKEPTLELRNQSRAFLTSLGFPPKRLFTVDDTRQVAINEERLPLRPKEKEVMSLLIEKRNQIVSANDIAERLWAEEAQSKYSLYAISKVVERLRKQVQAHGIFPGIIETRRGQGFVLND
ncbi:MAG: winged helix-turn-helix domain-containing protein [Patescibacteria group bacterium]